MFSDILHLGHYKLCVFRYNFTFAPLCFPDYLNAKIFTGITGKTDNLGNGE